MRTVSIRLEDLAKMTIKIGFVGENEHTRVCIDCKKAFDEYPGAVATLTVQPPAGEAYPDVTTRDGDTVIWDVEDHDLTDEGEGEFQLSFVVDETVMKSYIGRTAICRSIVPAGDVPSVIDDWLTRANAALAEIPIEIAEALEEAKESGEFDGRGISDAVLNDDYTLTLYFTDDTSYTTPSIRGENGEDGQDGFSPTASVSKSGNTATITITDMTGTTTAQVTDGEDGETGATPVISIGTVSTLTPGSDATASMDTTDPEHPVLSLGIPEGEPGDATIDDTKGYGDDETYTWSADKLVKSFDTKAPVIPCEVGESAIAEITDGVDGMPISGKVKITSFQAGSGTPSSSNIRTLYGFNKGVFYAAGKNLHGDAKLRDAIKTYLPSATINDTNKYIQFSAGASANTGAIATKSRASENYYAYVPFKENTRYTFVITGYNTGSSSNANMRIKYTDGTNSDYFRFDSTATTKQTIVFVSAPNKTVNYVQKVNSSNSTRVYYEESGVFEGALTKEDFVPYIGKMYDVLLPSGIDNVWGGYYTFNKDGTGTLTVTHDEIDSYDGETLPGAWVSDRDVYAEGTTPTTGAQVVYELAEPVTYELTGLAVPKTVKGENNIYAITGDVESINYFADTKIYIDSANETQDATDTAIKAMIADSDSVVATESHAEGDVFICGNNLYRATVAIASGETITVGTNVEVLNLADYIKEVITSVGTVASDVSTLQTDVTALKALPYPSEAINFQMLGLSDYTLNSGTQAVGSKLEGNKLTISGGSSNKYYTTFITGTHRRFIGSSIDAFSPDDFIPISWFFKTAGVASHQRKYCLRAERASQTATTGEADFVFKIALMKDNGDDTYTYKYTQNVGSKMNFQLTGGDLDLTAWDGIAIILFSSGCSVPTTAYLFVEEGDGLTYGLDQ